MSTRPSVKPSAIRAIGLQIFVAALALVSVGCFGPEPLDPIGCELLVDGTWISGQLHGPWSPYGRPGYCREKEVVKATGAASPGEAFIISATAHATGALGTNWRSDIEIHSVGDEPAAFIVSLLEHGVANTDVEFLDYTLDPGTSVRLDDVLWSAFSFEGQAAVVVVPTAGRIAATSRTYNLLGPGNDLGLPDGSTFGQYIPALPVSSAISSGEEARLIQLTHSAADDGGARTNLGLVSAHDQPIRVEVALYSAEGTLLGRVTTQLAAYGYRQINRIFDRVTAADVDDGYAVVRSTTADALFFAYASVVDNLTGDPIAIPAIRDAETKPGVPLYIAAAAHVRGAADTNWRTDLELHCPGPDDASVKLDLLAHGADNSSPTSLTYQIAAGASRRLEDVLFEEFGVEGGAALRVTATTGRVMATSRTFNLLGAGNAIGLPAGATFGQYIAGVPADHAIGFGSEARLIQLAHDPGGISGSRTNLILVNTTARAIDIRARLFAADGSLIGTVTRRLKPFEYRQLNKVFELVTNDIIDDGFAIVETHTGEGEFLVLASVVDNSTGDPVGMGAGEIRSTKASETSKVIRGAVTLIGQASIEMVVDIVLVSGPSNLVTAVSSWMPDYTSTSGDLVEIDFGSGTVLDNGSFVSGSIAVDLTGLSTSASGISGTIEVSHDDYLVDGSPPDVGPSSWVIDLTRRQNDTVVGTITAEGSPDEPGSVTGTIEIDTAICPVGPIGGGLTIHLGDEVLSINFDSECGDPPGEDISLGNRFSYAYGNPAAPSSQSYIVQTINAEVGHEGTVTYWRPMFGGETQASAPPGVILYHFPFSRPVTGGRIHVEIASWNFSYSAGRGVVMVSGDGNTWEQILEIDPPAPGAGQGATYNGDLPQSVLGSRGVWIRVELYSFGENAATGGIYNNTAEHSRWDANGPRTTFELEVEF